MSDEHLSSAQAAKILSLPDHGLIGAVQRGELYRSRFGSWSRVEIDRIVRSGWLAANRERLCRREMSIVGSLSSGEALLCTRAARARTRSCQSGRHDYIEAHRRSGLAAGGRASILIEQECSCGAVREVVRQQLVGPLTRVMAIRSIDDGAEQGERKAQNGTGS